MNLCVYVIHGVYITAKNFFFTMKIVVILQYCDARESTNSYLVFIYVCVLLYHLTLHPAPQVWRRIYLIQNKVNGKLFVYRNREVSVVVVQFALC